jgi:cytochrome c oxidase subunit 4
MAHGTQHATEEHGLRPMQYIGIGAGLTVVTIVELWISYADLGGLMIPLLLGLSAFKFAVVVGWFMHLRFDHPLYTKIFATSLALGVAVTIALITLYWTDAADGIRGFRAWLES